MILKLYSFLFQLIDSSIVSFFRIIFGCFMVYQMIYYYEVDYTFQFMKGPEVLFPYYGLSFLKPLSIGALKAIHFGMFASAILITLGFLYRYAMMFFFLGFSYFTFIDKTLYNNHLYLIALIAFVMIFIEADKKYSLRAKFSKKQLVKVVPAWNQYILIFLISLPYFFGGIAKLSSNWLDTNLTSVIIKQSNGSFLYQLLPETILNNLITYGGVLFDLSIVFILLNKRTRKVGLLLVVIFSLINGTILFSDIGIFPFFMICSTILFLNSDKVGAFLDVFLVKKATEKKFKNKQERKEFMAKQRLVNQANNTIENKKEGWNNFRRATAFYILVFVIFHLLFPFRYMFLTTNPEWTGIASRFSWRMKMQTRNVTEFDMSLTDTKTSNTYHLDGKSYVTKNQYIHMLEDPFTFIHLSKYISEKLERESGIVNPSIKAKIKVEFNGLPNQYMISPNVDLTKLSESPFEDASWIPPLKK